MTVASVRTIARDKDTFTRESLDEIFRELGKAFRKRNGTKTPAEIILVGGAAIIAGYGFREATTDIDALIHASSAMGDAIRQVGDRYGFSPDWLNQDFKQTASYSDRIVQYSVPYRTYANILHIRTLPAEYVTAMKLASLRQYKYDFSDVVGLIREANLPRDAVETAVQNLYGSFDNLPDAKAAQDLLTDIYTSDNQEELYRYYRMSEKEGFDILKNLNEQYPNLITRDNVSDLIAAARKKLS